MLFPATIVVRPCFITRASTARLHFVMLLPGAIIVRAYCGIATARIKNGGSGVSANAFPRVVDGGQLIAELFNPLAGRAEDPDSQQVITGQVPTQMTGPDQTISAIFGGILDISSCLQWIED